MKFSTAQMSILRNLDGATAPVEFDGTRKRTIDSLKRMGLVKYRLRHKSSPTYYYPGGSVLVLETVLTKEGSDFIYNGGIDK